MASIKFGNSKLVLAKFKFGDLNAIIAIIAFVDTLI